MQLDAARLKPVNWDDLRYFLAVHRRGSHKAAARLLRVAPTTVGRRIEALEAAAQAQLFVRTPERLKTTAAGLALLPHAEQIEAEILASERELQGAGATLEGPLRVAAGDALVNYVVVPALGDLLSSHPGLVLELRTDTAIVDLSRREADVALRYVRPKEPALVARRIGEFPFALFASDAYLQRRGSPRTLAATASHEYVGLEAALDTLPQVRWLHRAIGKPLYVLRATTTTTQAIACAEGLGLALLPVFMGARDTRLRQLFPRQNAPRRELWAVFHADLRDDSRISTFLSWVGDALAGDRD
jgi:DNA-binding transcriptional LysR family regulator